MKVNINLIVIFICLAQNPMETYYYLLLNVDLKRL